MLAKDVSIYSKQIDCFHRLCLSKAFRLPHTFRHTELPDYVQRKTQTEIDLLSLDDDAKRKPRKYGEHSTLHVHLLKLLSLDIVLGKGKTSISTRDTSITVFEGGCKDD